MKLQAELNIRRWTKEDFRIVKNILLVTWKDTYYFIPQEDLLSHFEKFYADEKLEDLLEDPFSQGIIAEVNSVPAGWMRLFEDQINKKFFVSSLYVLPAFQGYGVGKALLNEAYSIARQMNYQKIWLGVMSKNVKALEWYKNLGFNFLEEEPFQMGTTEVMHLIGYKDI